MMAGGQTEAVPSAPETAVSWRVCKTFVQRMWLGDGTMYDQCGIMTENPCSGGMQVVNQRPRTPSRGTLTTSFRGR